MLEIYKDLDKLYEKIEKIENENKKLHSIIKEVRKYIEKNTKEGSIKDKRYFYSPEQANDILEILDKEK